MAGYIGANTSSVTNNQNAAERRKKFTFTTATTALTGLSFLPDKIHIFHNGIRLVKNTDFTEAADGQSVTLINAAQAGDEVVAVTFAQDPASNAGYTDADVDAHLLTAGVTLDATNDKVGIGNAAPLGKLTISNAAGTNAPTSVTAANTYLQLGSDDFGPSNNGKFMIGFGYTDATNTNSPAYIGFEETNKSGDTKGDLTFYTRSVTTDTAPTERMRINEDGIVTKPNQPAFHARRTAGHGTTGTVVFNTADVNVGNNYNTSTGNFTAPIAGRYVFYTTLLSNNGTTVGIDLKINGTRYVVTEESWTVNAYRSSSATLIASLAANDAVRVENKTGGYYGANHYTFFGGYLLS